MFVRGGQASRSFRDAPRYRSRTGRAAWSRHPEDAPKMCVLHLFSRNAPSLRPQAQGDKVPAIPTHRIPANGKATIDRATSDDAPWLGLLRQDPYTAERQPETPPRQDGPKLQAADTWSIR